MPTSARWEPANSPQISMKTVRTARADVDIGPYKVLCRIVCEQQLRPYRINGTSGANR